uniref:DUF1740-domain-containing protein n=1 Tax=Mycena chlorophos TaxID=658473 RepID=A0ABQ0KZB9_MYCCL|nr:predicted protein [Mycena chlorophos]
MAAPSFSSFPDLPQANPSTNPDEHRRQKREKREKHDKHRKSSHPKLSDALQLDHHTTRSDEARSYVSDRRGDPANIQYGKLDSRDVPKYIPSRVVLGLSQSYQVARSGVGIIIGLRGPHRTTHSLTDASSRALLLRNPTRSLVNAKSTRYEEQDGFLRLPSRVAKPSYREIDTTADNSDSESQPSEPESSSDDDETFTSHEMKVINQRVTAHPSVANWLALLSHTLSTNIPPDSKNASRARAEISVSILSRALAATRNAPILRLKYLQAGEELWQENELHSEWEATLTKEGDLDMWLSWLDWRWRTCKKGIASLVADAERALAALEQDELGQVMIFWRLAVALKSAGYGERATAMFQAQAEIAFHFPPLFAGRAFTQCLDSLEEYWESETFRCGESSSLGWAAWLAAGRPTTVPQSPPSLEATNDLDPYRKFAFAETAADMKSFLPRRSSDPESENDPYTLVLFSDVRGVMFQLSSTEAKNAFRYAWLCLLGLNVPDFPYMVLPRSTIHPYQTWCSGYLARPTVLQQLFPATEQRSRITTDSVAGTTIGRERDYLSGLACPVSSWGWNVVHPLGIPSAQGKNRSLWSAADVYDIDASFVGNLFQQLRMPDDSEWDSLALAFACAHSMKIAIKLSRAFLSSASDSIAHWASHARLELLRDRPADARKVYETVLLSGPPRKDATPLWYDWAEMEWLQGRTDASVRVVLRSVGIEGSGGVALLRAKRSLDDAVDGAESSIREAWVKMRALLELLTAGGAEGLLQVYSGQKRREGLVVAELLMLYRHAVVLRNPMQPGLLRERAEAALDLYPDNSVCVGLFLESQRGQGMWGRVRNMLGGDDKSVVQRMQDVWIAGWDRTRWENERARNGLAAAITNERSRHCATIWRTAVELEIRMGDLPRAKQLLFRAIGDCPLSKELYLLAFGPLRSIFQGSELNAVADTMAERQIRLRHGLEEFLEGWTGESETKSLDEDIGSDDEIMREAEDYRGRLPYS